MRKEQLVRGRYRPPQQMTLVAPRPQATRPTTSWWLGLDRKAFAAEAKRHSFEEPRGVPGVTLAHAAKHGTLDP